MIRDILQNKGFSTDGDNRNGEVYRWPPHHESRKDGRRSRQGLERAAHDRRLLREGMPQK